MRRLNDEDGATAIMVALLLVVLFGSAAIAVDAGQLYQERRELQNGADAAALAIAEECARGLITCTIAAITPVADQYADNNANDLAADAAIDPADFDPSSRVTVIATSRDAATDEPRLFHWFAPVLGIDSTTVEARATVEFGGIGTLPIFPLAICEKSFLTVTADKTLWGPPAQNIYYGNDPAYACPVPSGETYPGGFGFLEISDAEAASACRTIRATGNWYLGMNGDGVPATSKWKKCSDALKAVVDAGEAINVPVYDNHRKIGGVPEFHIAGFAEFYISGFNFGGANHWYPGPKVCGSASTNCIQGYFTQFVTLEGAVDASAGDYGGTTVQLVQ